MVKKLSNAIQSLFGGKRSVRGESLVEVLSAILIGGFALLMLGVAISTSVRMASASHDSLQQYYTANNEIVNQSDLTDLGSTTITLTSQSTSRAQALVKSGENLTAELYGAGDSGVVIFVPGGGN